MARSVATRRHWLHGAPQLPCKSILVGAQAHPPPMRLAMRCACRLLQARATASYAPVAPIAGR
eukprot:13119446-Alexandrium_andersonii.AAC.1